VEEGDLSWRQVLQDFYQPFAAVRPRAGTRKSKASRSSRKVSDEVCEKCGRQMVIREGRFGKFLACPGFPQCRNTKPILESAGVPARCAAEGCGHQADQEGRTFYGCANYPNCNFLAWDKPSDTDCPQCGQRMYERKAANAAKHWSVCSANTGSRWAAEVGREE
jgi:DNA topoisomerase-1